MKKAAWVSCLAFLLFIPFAIVAQCGNNPSDGTPSPCTTLPVNLLQFRATLLQNNDVVLSWKFDESTSVDHFEVEHSSNLFDYKTRQQVRFQPSLYKYQAIDKQVSDSRNFYRLKIVEMDGQIAYSNILIVSINTTDKGLRIYPQPAHAFVNLTITAVKKQQNTALLFDRNGKQVKALTLQLEKGNNIFTIDGLSSLPPALYILKTIVDGKAVAGKIIIQ
jgi:hypothetical protein